jgi:hypothetical protein
MNTPGSARTNVLTVRVLLVTSLLVTIVWLTYVSPAQASFGIETFKDAIIANSGGTIATQAGSHPYALTTTVVFNHEPPSEAEENLGFFGDVPDGDPKTIEVNLPPGLVVDPQASEKKCHEAELESGTCPRAAAVGVASIKLGFFATEAKDAVYNMVPPAGTPAEFGFTVAGLEGVAAHIIGKVRTGKDYGISGEVPEITQKAAFYSASVTLWGIPSAASHDEERGECAESGGDCPVERATRPFLTMPTVCSGETLKATLSADSWQESRFISAPTESPGMIGCKELDFHPTLVVRPGELEAATADSPTGLSVTLRIPQEESLEGLAEADLREAIVTLPAGMTVSPSAANGLSVCTDKPEPTRPGGQIALKSAESVTCPNSSKLGTVEIVTPLLERPLHGSVYLAQQDANPFGSLLALYLVAEGSGALVKLPGKIELNGTNGQIRARFGEDPETGFFLPQLPFSELKMHFFGGPRAPLVTPSTCGTYTAKSVLTPYGSETPAEPASPAAEPQDSFTIASDCNGGGFAPTFTAGMTNNQAGGFSSFSTTFSRNDGEQDLGGITVNTPPGLLGMLSKVTLCGEAQANAGTCGVASEIGETTAVVGPGTEPYVVRGGHVYLTGPYNGQPFGLSIVVPTTAGPFTLTGNGGPGKEIVRASIAVNRRTGALTITSNPLPSILEGVPLDIRTVNVNVNREGFTFNPTRCEPLAVTGTITSTHGASSVVSSRFEAANCAALPFKPSFSASTQGNGRVNGKGASLIVKVAQRTGEANIRSVHLSLPKKLPARLTTLQKACTEVTFAENPALCPAASIVGTAVAHTPVLPVALEGPGYFVSHGGAKFPELIFVLQGYGVTIDLAGETSINSKKGITSSTFSTVPDAPITAFEARLPEQANSALATTTDRGLCSKKTLPMPTTITGQNGAQVAQTTQIVVTGCPKKHKPVAKGKGKKA